MDELRRVNVVTAFSLRLRLRLQPRPVGTEPCLHMHGGRAGLITFLSSLLFSLLSTPTVTGAEVHARLGLRHDRVPFLLDACSYSGFACMRVDELRLRIV